MMAGEKNRGDTRRRFNDAVNMTRSELDRWLKTDESRAVGQKRGRGESTGHASGRRIVRIIGKRQAELTDRDYAHMRKVTGYVARHMKQRPRQPRRSAWRYSLMNWGRDPLK